MRKKLLELVPEFDLIQDPELREKCQRTWEAAMEEGGWTPDALARMPFTLLINPCPVSYIDHIRAVTLTAIKSSEAFGQIYGDLMPVDRDLLVAGGLLHDIGKLLENENRDDGITVQTYAGRMLRHPFTGAALSFKHGLPDEITHIIALHAREGEGAKRSVEAIILTHADFVNYESLKISLET